MQKTTVLLTFLGALCTGPLLAQTNCAGYQVTPETELPDTAYVDVHERFYFRTSNDRPAFFSDFNLPPGYTTQGNYSSTTLILGEMQSPGTYEFSFVAHATESNCVDTVRIFRTYIESPTQICEPIGLRSSWNSGTEHYVGAPIEMRFFVTDGGEDPPFTFSGLDIRPGASLDSLGNYSDTTSKPENFTFRVVVKDRVGCTDTLSYSIFTQCPYGSSPSRVAATGRKGQYFEASVLPGWSLYPPLANAVASRALPAGLTLADNGVISGTPTTSGVFPDIEVRYTALGGCEGSGYIGITIEESAPVQSLWISPLCAQSLAERNWLVHNPNSFPINVNWKVIYASFYSGNFTAQPGDNYLSTPDGGWPNSIRITWYDQNQVAKSIVQGANDDLCTPPECASVAGVTFYNQGRQRDGTAVLPVNSYPKAVLGAPDANDGTNATLKSFSLGYNGFITMKLSANLYDQPGNDLKVWEYSLNDPSYSAYPERAEVFVSTDNSNWISLGMTNPTADCHAKLDWEFDLAGKATWCRFVKVVDVTERWAWVLDPVTCAPANVRAFNNASDGFDIDAITCVNPTSNMASRIASDESVNLERLSSDTESQFAVAYPNPATSWLTLDFSREPEFAYPDNGQVEVNIIDMTGKMHAGGLHFLDDEWKTKVNVGELSSGLFVAKVRAKGLTRYYKFIRN